MISWLVILASLLVLWVIAVAVVRRRRSVERAKVQMGAYNYDWRPWARPDYMERRRR